MLTFRYYFFMMILTVLFISSLNAQNQSGQDSTGLPGDNFSLQGALHLFQNAASPEDFEKQLNTESNHVNNLDLNGDGDIDYVRVVDKSEKDLHAFILQVPVSEKESQDIAVIELEKTGDTTAILQIVGDEDIYGEQVIVEPNSESDNKQGNKGGSFSNLEDISNAVVVVNVWHWPTVRYVYAPHYVVYVSPYHWHYYPVYWHPWHPMTWHYWHPYYTSYHHSFVVVHTHRVVHVHHIYTPVRRTSVTVHTRHAASINHYHVNKSKTTVHSPKGTTTVKKTTVHTPQGKATHTQVKRRH